MHLVNNLISVVTNFPELYSGVMSTYNSYVEDGSQEMKLMLNVEPSCFAFMLANTAIQPELSRHRVTKYSSMIFDKDNAIRKNRNKNTSGEFVYASRNLYNYWGRVLIIFLTIFPPFTPQAKINSSEQIDEKKPLDEKKLIDEKIEQIMLSRQTMCEYMIKGIRKTIRSYEEVANSGPTIAILRTYITTIQNALNGELPSIPNKPVGKSVIKKIRELCPDDHFTFVLQQLMIGEEVAQLDGYNSEISQAASQKIESFTQDKGIAFTNFMHERANL